MYRILLGFIAIGLLTIVGCRTSKRSISTIKDVDGNSYKTVKIGTQEWMAENLNLEHLSNGDVIQEAKTDSEWEKAGENNEPAWCYYDNDNQYDTIYGKLYNWYAIETGELCPTGWHVPTDAEWTLLENYLASNGHREETRGAALKSKSGWKDKGDGTSGNGTDVYGWLGLPGGTRYNNFDFSNIGAGGFWWSSSQFKTNIAWYRKLNYRTDYIISNYRYKYYGLSVRCLRD